MRIVTKQFTLRPLKLSDLNALTKNVNDKTIARYTGRIPYPYTVQNGRSWLRRKIQEQKKRIAYPRAIDINGELVGIIEICRIIRGHKASLGYWIAKKYRDQGIMSRAIREMVRYGFKTLKLKRIYAYVFPQNIASQKVLERNGFVKEGLLIKHVRKDNKFRDLFIFAKVK